MLGLIARFTCKDDVCAWAYDRLAEETLAEIETGEPGTIVYAVHRVDGQPLQRLHYQLYRDRAAFQAHEASPHTRRYLAERAALLDSSEVEWLTLQAGTGTGG